MTDANEKPEERKPQPWWGRWMKPVLIALAGLVVLTYTVLAIFWLPAWIVSLGSQRGVSPGDQLKAINDVRAALLGVLTPVVAVLAGIAAVLSFRETRRQNKKEIEATQSQLELNLQDQVNERFSRAIGQLGSENLAVRVGAIYSLEQIGRDTRKDRPGDMYWPTVGTLTAFIREGPKSPAGTQAVEKQPEPDTVPSRPRIAEDIQTALNVIGRRNPKRDRYTINLRGAKLDGARFTGDANFEEVQFEGASLRGAKLAGGNFAKANFARVNLEGADLQGADLQGADLSRTNLRGAIFERDGLWPPTQGLTREQLREAVGVDQDTLPTYLRQAPPGSTEAAAELLKSG